MGWWVVFCYVISYIGFAGCPKHYELALSVGVSDPVDPHIDSFGVAVFDVIVGKPDGGLVVGLEWCCRWGVAEFFKGGLHGAGLLGSEEGCPNFCLHGRAHDILHDFYWLGEGLGSCRSDFCVCC